MQVVTFANQKGGVGKSALCTLAARYLVAAGKRVLILDSDPQGNQTQGLVSDDSYMRVNLLKALVDRSLSGYVIHISDLLHLCPSTPNLDDAGNLTERRYKDLLDPVSDDYDFCLIDTPGYLGGFFAASVIAASAVVCPFTLENWGILSTQNTLVKIKGLDRTKPVFAVANLVKGSPDSGTNADFLSHIPALFGDSFVPGVTIPNSAHIRNSINTSEVMSDAVAKHSSHFALTTFFNLVFSIQYSGGF